MNALGLEPQRRLVLESHQRQGEFVFKHLRAGLLGLPEPAKAAAAVMRQPFEIDHGPALLGEGQQNIGFAAAGAAS